MKAKWIYHETHQIYSCKNEQLLHSCSTFLYWFWLWFSTSVAKGHCIPRHVSGCPGVRVAPEVRSDEREKFFLKQARVLRCAKSLKSRFCEIVCDFLFFASLPNQEDEQEEEEDATNVISPAQRPCMHSARSFAQMRFKNSVSFYYNVNTQFCESACVFDACFRCWLHLDAFLDEIPLCFVSFGSSPLQWWYISSVFSRSTAYHRMPFSIGYWLARSDITELWFLCGWLLTGLTNIGTRNDTNVRFILWW